MKTKNIIFIHGWASGPYVWIHQASYFKDRCAVHTPELIGYGKRRLVKGDAFGLMVKDIKDFINQRKLEDICIAGWSMGGMVSLKLAADLKTSVRRLILISTSARFVQTDDFKYGVSKAVLQKIHRRMRSDFQGTLQWFYKFCFSAHERSQNEFSEALKLLGDFITPLNMDTLLRGLELLMDFDMRHLLEDITAPTLLIHGRDDRICPPEAAAFLAKRLKKAKVKIVDKTGHAPFLTMPKKVNTLIEDFIS